MAGARDARTGRVSAHQRSRSGGPPVIRCSQARVAADPGRRLSLVQATWSVHCPPAVLAARDPQPSPCPVLRPRAWPTAPSPQARRLTRPSQLVPRPPSASWLKPIEQLGCWLKQDGLHLQRRADARPALRARGLGFLLACQHGSPDLLPSVGLPIPTSFRKLHHSTHPGPPSPCKTMRGTLSCLAGEGLGWGPADVNPTARSAARTLT